MPDYRIKSAFWDGRKLHPAGSVLSFEEGAAPRGSVLAKDSQPEPSEGAKAKSAATASAGPKTAAKSQQ